MEEVYINSLGCFLPGAPVSNNEMEDYIGKIHGKSSRYKSLVLRQNRIKTRYYALDKNGKSLYSNSQMAAAAIKNAVSKSEILLSDFSFLATSTSIGDVMLPGLASNVHSELNIKPIELASFQSVCASSLMAFKSAFTQLKCGEHKCAVVSGSEFASRYFKPSFYEQTNLLKSGEELFLNADFLRFTLSDGAGAAVLENRPNTRQLSLKIKWIDIRSFADRFDMSMVAGGIKELGKWSYWGDSAPLDSFYNGSLMLTQDFELMKQMIPVWVSHYLDLIDSGKIEISKIDHLCSHYSSNSIREEAIVLLKKAGAMIDEEKWFSNLVSKGNTGAASIFILLEELYGSGKLKKGETILCHVPESGRALNGFMLLEVV